MWQAMAILIGLTVLCLLAMGIIVVKTAEGAELHKHLWYPQNCCSGSDCEEIPVEAINETETGWEISVCSAQRPGVCITGAVKRGQEKASQDGSFHLCFNSSRIICFFVPSTV